MGKTKHYYDATRESMVAAIEAEHIDPAVMASLLEWATLRCKAKPVG